VVSTDNRVLFSESRELIEAESLRYQAEHKSSSSRGYLLSGDPRGLDLIGHIEEEFDTNLARMKREADAEGRMLLEQIERADDEHDAAINRIVTMRRQGTPLIEITHYFDEIVLPTRTKLEDSMRDLVHARQHHLDEGMAAVDRASVRAHVLLVGIAIGGVLLAVIMAAVFMHTLSTLYRQSQEAVRARDDFLSAASHELKTPLTTLQLQVQGLMHRVRKAPFSPEEVSPRLETAARQITRTITLLNTLLDISRVQGGYLRMDRIAVDLARVTREVAGRLGQDGDTPGIQLTADTPVVGYWDPMRLDQVVTNLLTNAIKYGGGEPVDVAVGTRAGGAVAVLTVRDHGVGIPPEEQERLFAPFERATTGKRFPGTGLGLWISGQIVAAHGGAIRVESAVGAGAKFTVELPIEQAMAEKPRKRAVG
jgi:signal transduction histidine kinase